MELEKRIVEEIVEIASKYNNIDKIFLFGSRARGNNSPKSDIDLAIYANGDFSEFIEEIETKTTTLLEYDFANMNNIKDELFLEQVRKEGIAIYEKH